MSRDGYSLSTIKQFVGQELGVSQWMTIDQERINQFADCTNDHQWIHVDIERAKRESPFGAPVAHGFLTLSLLPSLQGDVGIIPAGVAQVINYGLDRVRFMAPVKVGSRIRDRVVLMSAEEQAGGRILIKTQNTIEIEGENKPAVVAESLSLVFAARARRGTPTLTGELSCFVGGCENALKLFPSYTASTGMTFRKPCGSFSVW